MLLQPWSHSCSAGFTLRGWRTPPSGKPLLHFLHGNGFCGRTYEPLLRLLAADFDSTVSEAKRLFSALSRPNVMIKIPATPEGVRAVQRVGRVRSLPSPVTRKGTVPVWRRVSRRDGCSPP